MMHCVGILHEHFRDDREKHGVTVIDDHNEEVGVKVGHYDYSSLMHYCSSQGVVEFESNSELINLQALADRGDTFSAGDLSCIKGLYTFGGKHRG